MFMNSTKVRLVVIFLLLFSNAFAQGLRADEFTVVSPDKNITVTCNPKQAVYRVSYKGELLLSDSKLGVIREDDNFSKNLTVVDVSSPVLVKDSYSMLNAKKKTITYTATEREIQTQSASGKKMNIIFRVSNDGVAFRYEFPETSSDKKKIKSEETTFHFQNGTRAWLQPKAEAQSGWEHSNPS